LVAAMANLMECRRQNLDQGHVVTPMDSYNLDLLHQYDLEKLQKIVCTLLFRRKEKSFDCHPPQEKTKRKKTKFNPSQPQQQQQTIFFHKKNTTPSAPFSFDDDISEQEEQENENRYESPIPSSSPSTSKRKRKHRRK